MPDLEKIEGFDWDDGNLQKIARSSIAFPWRNPNNCFSMRPKFLMTKNTVVRKNAGWPLAARMKANY